MRYIVRRRISAIRAPCIHAAPGKDFDDKNCAATVLFKDTHTLLLLV